MTQLATKKQEVLTLIEEVGGNRERIVQALESSRKGADTVSHQIFQVYPDPKDGFRQLEHCQVEAVSRWAFTSLLKVCDKHETDAAALLYKRLSKIPTAGALCAKSWC